MEEEKNKKTPSYYAKEDGSFDEEKFNRDLSGCLEEAEKDGFGLPLACDVTKNSTTTATTIKDDELNQMHDK